jgi:hypothetical protein
MFDAVRDRINKHMPPLAQPDDIIVRHKR